MLRSLLFTLLILVPASVRAQTVLPDLTVRLVAARYVPVEEDLHWLGWIGAGAGVLRVQGVTAYFAADVETIIGNSRRAFEANQANYHLETGLRRPIGRHEIALAFHHVSRHYVDRPKVQAVDWNILGLRVSGEMGTPERPWRYAGAVGHTTLASLVGYGWEVTAHLDRDLLGRPSRALYAATDARFVTSDASPALARGAFLDLSGEAGVRWRGESRELCLFALLERRNDVFLEEAGRRDRGLFGLRIVGGRQGIR